MNVAELLGIPQPAAELGASIDAKLLADLSPTRILSSLPQDARPHLLQEGREKAQRAIDNRALVLIESYLALVSDQERKKFAAAHLDLIKKSYFASIFLVGDIQCFAPLHAVTISRFERDKFDFTARPTIRPAGRFRTG
jgi:hypothetical protein